MPVVLYKGLDLGVPENACCTMGQPGIQGLVHKWLELLNHKFNVDILKAVKLFHRVSMI